MKPVLIAHTIQKFFHTPTPFEVLKGASLQINEGEIVAIYGPSGNGKSTLLYILSTLDTDYKGELIITGIPIQHQNSTYLAAFRNQHIGFIYQFHHLLSDFNVLENVMLPALKLNIKSKEEIRQEALLLLEEVGLQSKIHHTTTRLSGGEQQRVAIARALINQPSIIFADEPTGNLDYENSQLIFSMLKEICAKKNTSILIVSHDPNIYKNTDRSFIMKEGILQNTSVS